MGLGGDIFCKRKGPLGGEMARREPREGTREEESVCRKRKEEVSDWHLGDPPIFLLFFKKRGGSMLYWGGGP